MADLRDKRDKAKRALDRLVEGAVRKEKVYREAAVKVNTQRGECDELERQVELARVQVQLPTPLPSLPGDGDDTDPCLASEVLGGSEDEAQRDCEAGLGMDVEADPLARKQGRGASPSAPPKPNLPHLRLKLKRWVLWR